MTKLFKKSKKKKTYFGPFFSKSGQEWIFLKKKAVNYQLFQLSTIMQKIRKNYWAIPEKNAELTDGQIDNVYFIGPSVGR